MVINRDGLITENQNAQVKDKTFNKELAENGLLKNSFDLNGNNHAKTNLIGKETVNIDTFNKEEQTQKIDDTSSLSIDGANSVPSNDNFFETTDESTSSEDTETVETNCLALTVRKDYNYAIAKNTVFKTIRMSIKVAISTFVLNLIKLFF